MQPAASTALRFMLVSVPLLASLSAFASDQKAVRFDSVPPGAQVELQCSILCTTPCSAAFPGYYFSKHFTYWSKRLSESLRVRFTKAGYVPKDVTITVGPLRWQAWNTPDYFDYYRINDEQFTVRLDAATEFLSPTSAPTA